MTVKTFRNLLARIKYLDLEIADWIVLAFITGFLFSVIPWTLVNFMTVFVLWSWLRFVKGKQPPGHPQALLEFIFAPKVLRVMPERPLV